MVSLEWVGDKSLGEVHKKSLYFPLSLKWLHLVHSMREVIKCILQLEDLGKILGRLTFCKLSLVNIFLSKSNSTLPV